MSIEEREQISLQVTVSVYLDAALRQAGVCDKTHKAGSGMIWSQLSMLGFKKKKKKKKERENLMELDRADFLAY